MPNTEGHFIWYDLVTTSVDAAAKFYTEVLGWGTQVWKGPPPYIMFENEGVPLGGVVEVGRGMGDAPPHWLPYVCVEDVAASATLAAELGGRVVLGPRLIPEAGQYAILADPQGASFAVYRSVSPSTGLEATSGRGQFSWHELTTTDYKSALVFYGKLFGWEPIAAHDMGAMGIYQIYGKDGKQFGGMFDKTPEMLMPPNWLCYVMIDDINQTVEKVSALGGQVLIGPHEVPGGSWIAQCMDPQGGMFAVQTSA